jgi:GNAT superfamily N-acetyltransferase
MTDIRQCTIEDLPYIYEICYLTGYDKVTLETICEDKYKTGHYYAAPYLYFDIECCFVVTVENIPKGYILGTHDTETYTQWLNTHWLPKVRKYYDLQKFQNRDPFETHLNNCIINDTEIEDRLKDYPAHLHIDLLPELQGKGMGRKLIEVFFNRCREKGAQRVHLGVSKENPGAIAFYNKLGMYVISEDEEGINMGYDL